MNTWWTLRLFLCFGFAVVAGGFAAVTIHYPPTIQNWIVHESPEISRN